MIEDILRREFYHNRLSEYLVCLAIILGGVLVVRIVEGLSVRRLKAWAEKTPATYDDFLVGRIRGTGIPLAYLAIVQASLRVLTLTPRVERIIDMAGIVLLTLIVIVFTVSLVRYGFEEYSRKRGEDATGDRALRGVIGVTYQTPASLLREIPGIVADIFRELEGATLDRVHFFSYGDFSLIHEIVYYVDGNDYTRYMDLQQKANLRIYEEFGKRRITFAYPTRTLYLTRS